MLWCSRTFWRKMCSGLVFFSRIQSAQKNFLSSVVDCRTKHTKRGESRLALTRIESNRRPRNATQKKRVLIITNSPVVGTVENEIDFFSVRRPFRSTLCWLNAYRGERSSISSNACRIFSPLLSVLTGQSRERKNHKNHVDEHIGRKKLPFKSSEIKEKNV